ncbi:hypothetical protein ACWC09_45850 [Streptomyces sp. NPDC001617]
MDPEADQGFRAIRGPTRETSTWVYLMRHDLSDLLRMRGWQVSFYLLPPNRQETVIQRVLVRHGVDRDEVGLLAADMGRAIKRLDEGGPRDANRAGFHR